MSTERMQKRVCVETRAQLNAALSAASVDAVYLDACFFGAEEYARLAEEIRSRGKEAGLRFPQVWRTEAERYFTDHLAELKEADFSLLLVRSMEGLLFLEDAYLPLFGDALTEAEKRPAGADPGEAGPSETGPSGADPSGADPSAVKRPRLVLDHSIYVSNGMTQDLIRELLPAHVRTLSLELDRRELQALVREESGPGMEFELQVYGRVPMMISRQCVRHNTAGCSRQEELLFLKDRKGALMPVKNCCRFCFNTIYNSVPTLLYDLEKEIADIAADAVRYEFTTETGEECSAILSGGLPPSGSFTRGHFRKSVD